MKWHKVYLRTMTEEEKEDLFSSDVCIVGDNEIDMNEVEHIAYKRI